MKLIDYAHYYIGCRCLNTWFTPDHDGYNAGWKLEGFHASRARPYGLENEHDITWTDSVKLILNRLEDLTQDEIIGLLQAMIPIAMDDKPLDEEYILEVFKNDGGNLVNSDVVIGANYNIRCFDGTISIKNCGTICFYDEAGDEQEGVNMPSAYRYLLQRHYDVFGLIDAGLAVDAKTLG